MCGIAGEIRRTKKDLVSPDAIRKMSDLLQHRGPDGQGDWFDNDVVLAHRRLKIIDLSEASAQPLVLDSENVAITFNGEIYNYRELRNELVNLGHSFQSSGDTEVLLRAYLQWGAEVFTKLNGMYAFAIFDRRTKTLLAGRDPVGQKPFLYFFDNHGLVFASELSALLAHPRCPRDVTREHLMEYLAFDFSPSPNTILQNVWRLPPGHALHFQLDSDSPKIWRHWHERPQSFERSAIGSVKEAGLDSIEQTLRQAVARHLRSDAPIGVYLSGGIDSTLLSALATQILGRGEVKTFSIRVDEPSYDEADMAKATAATLGTVHHERVLSSKDFLDGIPKLLSKLDEPLADPGFFAVAQVSQFAAETIKVALSGDGGDEFFYGYEPFLKWKWARKLDQLPPYVVEGLRGILGSLPAQYSYMGLRYKILTFLRAYRQPKVIKNVAWSAGYLPSELTQLINGARESSFLNSRESDIMPIYRSLEVVLEEGKHLNDLDFLGSEFQNSYLTGMICPHTDKANMIYSLEPRSPFLDNEVIRLANSLPASYKVRDGKGKWVLREIVRKHLPESPVAQARKRGFTVPLGRWLRGDLKDWASDILFSDGPSNHFFSNGEIQRIWTAHQNGHANNYKKLWPIIVYKLWHQRWLG